MLRSSDETELAARFQAVVDINGQNQIKSEEQQRILQLQCMAASEIRARELENQFSPELRSQELENAIAQAQYEMELSVRDAERALNLAINDGITKQTDAINQQVHNINRQMAQTEHAIRDIESSMTRQAQAGRLQFGIYQQPPRAPVVAQAKNPERRAFSDEEFTLVSDYLDDLYAHSASGIEKRAIDKLRDPIYFVIMRDPVFLTPDGRTYNRATLLEMLNSGRNTCPETRRPFTIKDLIPDYDAIGAIQEFLEDAIRAENSLKP